MLDVVEPIPEQRGAGRVILLNGASSSGKSTLATALQAALPQPFLHVSSDQLVQAGMLPHRTSDGGAFDWWHQIRPRFFAGFHRCLPAFAEAGNDLIVDHVIESSGRCRVARRPLAPSRTSSTPGIDARRLDR